jgi:hypothetical protein
MPWVIASVGWRCFTRVPTASLCFAFALGFCFGMREFDNAWWEGGFEWLCGKYDFHSEVGGTDCRHAEQALLVFLAYVYHALSS